MKKIGLLTTLIALAIALPMEAGAKGRVRSSHSHASHDAQPRAASESHAAEGGSGIIRNAVARPHRSPDGSASNESGALPGSAAANEEDANLRRIREEKAAARAKRDAETLAARKLQQEADAEKRRELAEQAALNASEAEKRKEAETRAKNRELAQLERQQRQAAWEARCQVKPVMTDAEIATCKEVWTTAAR